MTTEVGEDPSISKAITQIEEKEEEIHKIAKETYYSIEELLKMRERSENDGDETNTEAEKSSDEEEEELIQIEEIIEKKENLHKEEELVVK